MSIRTVFTIRHIYNGSQIKLLIWWFTSSLESFIWLMWFWFISLGCTLVSGQGLCGLTQLHNLDELELTNCPSATREVCLYLRENMAHCLVVDWKTPPTIRVRSYWNLRVKKKNPLVITWPVQIFARSYEIFKFCNNLLGSACFLSKLRKWTDEAAGYYNPTPENTYRPFVTKDIDSIFFFLIKTVSTTHPPLFHYPLFLCDSFKIFYTCTFKFPPFVFFLFFDKLNLSYHWK